MIRLPPDFRQNISPYRVFFTWDITYKCNYKCSYCIYTRGDNSKELIKDKPISVDVWLRIWRNVYNRYGSCEIHFAGGEPFVYPGFMDLIDNLSDIHTLEFSTNLFWDPADFIRRIDPGRARIGVSFHPEFSDLDIFLSKALKLKEAGFEIWVNYVAYPPQMYEMENIKNKFFDQYGITINILPYKGRYEDKEYPEGYTQQEIDYLKSFGTNVVTPKILESTSETKQIEQQNGRFCRMGQMYAKIRPDGEVFVCCASNALRLGNIIKGTFALREKPFLCKKNNCPCWKSMLVGREEYWENHWIVPSDARRLTLNREWDKKYNSKEAEITSVRIFNRLDEQTDSFQCGEDIKVLVKFKTNKTIIQPHFGVAIFREDGVYCYGCNTLSDGYIIERLNSGIGYFAIEFKNPSLAPGHYRFSIAIWDRYELHAYSYHVGLYKFQIEGINTYEQLLLLCHFWRNGSKKRDSLFIKPINDKYVNLGILRNMSMNSFLYSSMDNTISAELIDSRGAKKDCLNSNENLEIKLRFNPSDISIKNHILWIGIYKSDSIYCHGTIKELGIDERECSLVYPNLPLLKGNYYVDIGIWEKKHRQVLFYKHKICTFKVSSLTKEHEHGIVHLAHSWNWKLPAGNSIN